MRAVELNIVLVDDDGKTYLKTYKTGDPRIGARVLDVIRDVFWEYTHDASASMSSVGPVLRKVTEIEGRVEDWPGDEAYISGTSRRPAMLSSVIPDEARKDCTTYRFRFDVIAVRVLSPENKDGAG